MVLIMKRIRFYVGTQLDMNNQAIPATEAGFALEAFGGKLCKWAGGYSMSKVAGKWVNEEGIVMAEESAVFEVLRETDSHEDYGLEQEVLKLARTLKHLLDQQAVLYTIEVVQGGMV